jgi:hypothetical protein
LDSMPCAHERQFPGPSELAHRTTFQSKDTPPYLPTDRKAMTTIRHARGVTTPHRTNGLIS